MSKQRYRSEIGIMGDILDVTASNGREGVLISAISRKANLSHYAVHERCEKLISAGLVHTPICEKKKAYTITEKGIQFFRELTKFQDLAASLNLRC